MGCTGSKYQSLSADAAVNGSDDTPVLPADPAAGTPQKTASPLPLAVEPTTPAAEPATPASAGLVTPSTPGSHKDSPPPADLSGSPTRPIPELQTVDLGVENGTQMASGEEAPASSSSSSAPAPAGPVSSSSSSAAAPAGPSDAPDAQQAWEAITTATNTVIIFDWDDTLFCSSALHCCLPKQFIELEELVERVLHAAMELGRTIIVTNAMESWIQETTRRFMPRLMPTLEQLLIVYARKNWERLWPGDTFAWKRESFREVLHDKLGVDLNLVVLGDSFSEIRAAEGLIEHLGSSALVKTVKFKALPSPADLLGELRTITPELERLVQEKHNASRELIQDVPSTGNVFGPGSMLQGSTTWQLGDAVPNEMFTPPPGIYAHQHLWTTTQITI